MPMIEVDYDDFIKVLDERKQACELLAKALVVIGALEKNQRKPRKPRKPKTPAPPTQTRAESVEMAQISYGEY
jgi:hypothetical protein